MKGYRVELDWGNCLTSGNVDASVLSCSVRFHLCTARSTGLGSSGDMQ